MNDGGPAFPVVSDTEFDYGYHSTVDSPGMSLRDWFAGQALAGWLATYAHPAGPQSDSSEADSYARVAYHLADAMLAERQKKE